MVSVSPTARAPWFPTGHVLVPTHDPELGDPYSKMCKPTISFRDRQGSKSPSPLSFLPYPGVLEAQSQRGSHSTARNSTHGEGSPKTAQHTPGLTA